MQLSVILLFLLMWRNAAVSLTRNACSKLPDVLHALESNETKKAEYQEGDVIRFTCEPGYTSSQTSKYICTTGGWLPISEGTCYTCSTIPDVPNAHVSEETKRADYHEGDVIHFICEPGYTSGPTIKYVCASKGWLAISQGTCRSPHCDLPPADAGLTVKALPENGNPILPNHTITFSCEGSGKHLNGNSVLTCGEDGQWNNPFPSCRGITCKLQLPAIRGTRYDPVFRNVFSPGDRATVTCGDRYWISSPQDTSAEITCKEDGKWTIENPVCQEVRCHYRPDPHVTYWRDYWRQKTALGDTVGYQCIKNYKHTNNVQVATCTRDGWTPKPLCQEIVCNRLEIENAIVVVDSDKQIYKNHEQVEYICKTGFTGRFFITCGRNGWSRYPQCTAITCNSRIIPNAEIVGPPQNEYRYNDQVEYTCTNGYEGRFTLTCGETGLKGSPQCTKLCGKPKIDKAKITYNEKESYSQADKVEFTCTNNDEHFMVTCENGDWTGVKRCTEKCREIPEIPNGEVKSEDKIYEQDESVPVTCIEGYSAQVHKLTCHEGQWNSAGISYTTICTPLKCPPPPKLKNAVVLNLYQREYLSNTIITYQCRDHYTMEGENHIQCINGKWEEKNFMCTQYCDPLEPEEQTMEFAKDKERYMNGDVIKYQCIVSGVKIEGEATCVNGKWNKTEECKDSQSKSNPSTTDTAELGNIPLRNSDTDSVPQTISMV